MRRRLIHGLIDDCQTLLGMCGCCRGTAVVDAALGTLPLCCV